LVSIPHDLKGKEWFDTVQAMRGNWKKNPAYCCALLWKYLGDIKNVENIKIKIVMRYLTSPGFRAGKISHPCIIKIRSRLSAEIKIRKMKKVWD